MEAPRTEGGNFVEIVLVNQKTGAGRTLVATPEVREVFVRAEKLSRSLSSGNKDWLTYTSMLVAALEAMERVWPSTIQALPRGFLGEYETFEEPELKESSAERYPTEGPAPDFAHSEFAGEILTRAGDLRDHVSGAPVPLDTRHLLGAYLFSPDIRPGKLEELDIDPSPLAAGLVDAVERLAPDEYEVWRGLFHEIHGELDHDDGPPADETASSPVDSRWDRPTLDNDAVLPKAIPGDRDRLGRRGPAERFAKLLVAKDVDPPIALGLFGSWGSGKSFFMGLVRGQIEELCRRGEGSEYVARVAQIDFNAWHYQDTSLWATLALRIFDGLAEELAGEKSSTAENLRFDLQRAIRSSSEDLRAAERSRDDAVQARTRASRELERWRKTREREETKGTGLRLDRLWTAMREEPKIQAANEELLAAANRFGLDTAAKTGRDVQQLAERLEDLSGRARGLGAVLGRRFGSLRASAGSLIVIAIVLLAVFVLGRGLEELGKLLGWAENTFSQVSVAIVQLSALVASVTAWAGKQLDGLSKGLSAVERIRDRYLELDGTGKPSPEEVAWEERVREADARVRGFEEERDDADRRLREAVEQIQQINQGRLVYDFLEERRGSSDYREELGLISTIRQDLEALENLLEDFATYGSNPIERIILYIDDLDRCHPQKVVEVLQAVHLLLAFPLFNVVVGVDARWLERSLYCAYLGEGASGEAPGSRRGDHAFSPQNYLEKIFQIPYSLARMGETGFGDLVAKLIKTRSQAEEEVKERKVVEGKGKSEGKSPPSEGQGSVTPPADGEPPSDDEPGSEERDRTELEAELRGLFLEDFEAEFIKQLHAFVGTPRLAKRLVNVYRLIRVRATEEGFESFLRADGTGTYRAALLLLAINIGYPRIGAKLLWMLARKPEVAQIDDVLASILRPESERPKWANRLPWNHEELADVRAVRSHVAVLGDEVPSQLAPYSTWAPLVGCYSFDWHLVGLAEDGGEDPDLEPRALAEPPDER